MSNLDNLVSKIMSDFEAKSGSIIEEANAQAAAIIHKCAAQAEDEKKAILDSAAAEALKTAEQIIIKKKLEIRDENLRAKRVTIDRIFGLALERLNNIPKDQYLKFINNSIGAIKADSGEIVLSSLHDISADDITAPCISINRQRHVNGGFILIKDGIEYNFTFESMLEYRRNELEGEIIKILFR